VALSYGVAGVPCSGQHNSLLGGSWCFGPSLHFLSCATHLTHRVSFLQLRATSRQHEARRYKLIGWAIEKGLVCQLAQAALLVWGLDPAPYKARGSQGLQQLTQLVRMATLLADRLPVVVTTS
jgi:hypothetical protein